MRISENITIYAGMDATQMEKGTIAEKKNSVYAGNLNQNLFEDKIAQRKEQAKQQAMKVVKDVWESDKALDEDLDARRERIRSLRKEMQYAQSRQKSIEDSQKQLQEEYGVASDSKEQKDLELLRCLKGLDYGNGAAGMTTEELKYAKELEAQGLTEYQQRQLEFDREKKVYQEQYAECFQNMRVEIATISATKLERLKHSPMVKAQKQADEIEKAASKEILGMLLEEGKEHLEELQEEKRDKAEKLEEQKEEQEAFIEAQKEKKQKQEELLEEMPVEEMITLHQNKTDIQKEVQNIVDKMKLVAEDIKGSMIDANV